jgi:periplasmic copper chaperone A
MKTIRLLAALPVLLIATCLQAEVLVTEAWVRGLPPGVATASAYMTLRNTGGEDVVLTGASSPLAGSVLIHTTMNHGGMLHMTHIESLTLPAGSEVKLESGGTHLMLTELAQSPAPGMEVELTLEFANGTTQVVRLPVRSVLDE